MFAGVCGFPAQPTATGLSPVCKPVIKPMSPLKKKKKENESWNNKPEAGENIWKPLTS